MLKPFIRLAALLLISLMLFACSQRAMNLRESTPPPAVSVEDRKHIRQLLAQEEYTAALDLMKKKILTGASEQNFSTLYVTAVNGLISRGDIHLGKNEQTRAGVDYSKALNYYPSDETVQRKVNRSYADLKGTVKRLSIDLMDAALLKYRAGSIKEAIAIWDGILSFDPLNTEAKKARDTAVIQLENLKKME